MYFHLPDQHNVLYEDHDDIDDVLSKPTISDSKFLAWMNTNKGFAEANNLTYSQFVSKFVYNKRNRSRQLRKKKDIPLEDSYGYHQPQENCFI